MRVYPSGIRGGKMEDVGSGGMEDVGNEGMEDEE
jgi:hypothetical protein